MWNLSSIREIKVRYCTQLSNEGFSVFCLDLLEIASIIPLKLQMEISSPRHNRGHGIFIGQQKAHYLGYVRWFLCLKISESYTSRVQAPGQIKT